jgi:hypothetical protein
MDAQADVDPRQDPAQRLSPEPVGVVEHVVFVLGLDQVALAVFG